MWLPARVQRPVEHPVDVEVDRHAAVARRHLDGIGAASSARKSAQHAPSLQVLENTPGTPASPSAATQRTVRSTCVDTASESATGDPSITRPATERGLRTASDRASAPPRLCPIRKTGSPASCASSARRFSSLPTIASAQPTFVRMPLMRTRWPRRRSHWRSTPSEGSPAMKPGISIAGGASSRRLTPWNSRLASSRASSRP